MFIMAAAMLSHLPLAGQNGGEVPFNGIVETVAGDGVPRMTVMLKGSSKRTSTDRHGRFGLVNVPEDGVLVLSRRGEEWEIPLEGRRSLRVVMSDDGVVESEESEDLISLGFAFVKRRDAARRGASGRDDRVTQNRRLVLQADVSQRYYDRVREIVSANFMTPSMKEAVSIASLGGRLLSVGRSSAESSYYIPVAFEFVNNGDIVPGSFAEVWLRTAERQGVLSLPVSAITEEQGLYFVYLKLDGSCYRKQEVMLGESDGIRVEIISGLKAGDNVVVKGAYNVRLASASNVIPAHTHNH